MLSRIKKNDTVVVLSGKDKGKQGQVIAVDYKKNKVLVKDVAIVSRHVKARSGGEKSRIVKEESLVPLCKVMPVCPACKKACRVRVKFLDEKQSTKSRICSRCQESF